MTDSVRAVFLQDIIANPDDDFPRLAFADWLMDHGEPEYGKFIYLSCQYMELAMAGRQNEAISLHLQAGELLESYADRVRLRFRNHSGYKPEPTEWAGAASILLTRPGTQVWWERGFPSRVRCRYEDWQVHGKNIVLSSPVRHVSLSNRFPTRWVRNEVERWVYFRRPMRNFPLASTVGIFWDHLQDKSLRWCGYSSSEVAENALSEACLGWARQPGQ